MIWRWEICMRVMLPIVQGIDRRQIDIERVV
jgi:hypothetical protein